MILLYMYTHFLNELFSGSQNVGLNKIVIIVIVTCF